ncbi:MAG TPA: hypothetical protein VFD30_22755 [Terriglobia bacterium]|nr:hypothetical protein [Terriglobia bacterium]
MFVPQEAFRAFNNMNNPGYVTAAEQQRIEFCAPNHLKNVVVIMSEMGLRPYKELLPMKKSQLDLENSLVYVPDSKTPSGVGDMPMTDLAKETFRAPIEASQVPITSSRPQKPRQPSRCPPP